MFHLIVLNIFTFLTTTGIQNSGNFTVSSINLPVQDSISDLQILITNEDRTYKDFIKTVLLYKKGNEESYPMITLNAGEELFLSFDDLRADIKDYQYTVIHCTSDWEKSDLKPFEYLEGYFSDLIEESQSSFRSTIPYTHYTLSFPNQYLKITKSGNYILKVYIRKDTDENTAFTMRFMVLDPKVSIEGTVKRAFTGVEEDLGFDQKIEFILRTGKVNISNPYYNLQVVITQNRRWDNAITDLEPTSISGKLITYDPMGGNSFKSGNEYRNFDIKDMYHQTEFLAKIEDTPEGYFVKLKPDERKTFKPYFSETDLNGRYLIRAPLGRDPAFESEYVYVSFYLPYDYPLIHGDMYITCQLTNWQLDDQGKMTYNYRDKAYEKTMLLKQGYYNYIYAFLESKKSMGDVTFIEGNHWEANNEYMIYVYFLAPGTTYQQLIGAQVIYSH